MDADLSASFLLGQLEGIAETLGIQVRYESLADEELAIHSGGCRVLGRPLVLIDSRQTPWERARILARELSRHDLEDLYILPRVREFILLHSGPRP